MFKTCRYLLLLVLFTGGVLRADAPSTQPADVYVAVGYGGRRVRSTDGIHWDNDARWSDQAADNDDVLFSVAFGQEKFVAVGGGAKIGHILTTRDGKEWRELPQQKGRVATIAFAKDADGKERWVAGHSDDFLYSFNGEEWKAGEKLDLKGSVHFRKSAAGNGTFVHIGDWDPWGQKRINFRAVTGDGEHVVHVDADAPASRAIAFGNGRFVVVGPDGLRESSTDGVHWEHRASEPGENLSSVIWNGKQFLVAGGKFAYTSPDGVEWKKEPKGIPCSVLYCGNDIYLGASWGGNLWHSADGVKWEKGEVIAGPSLEAITWGARGRQ